MIEPRGSAVIVPVELPRALEAIRLAGDPVAALGIPAHVTVLFPFLEPARLGERDVETLRRVVAGEPTFDLELGAVRTFAAGDDDPAGVVYLAPQPAEPFRRLTAAVWAAFPDRPPYGGQFDEVVPHLTIAMDTARRDEIEAVVRATDPVRRSVREAWLVVEGEDGRWSRRATLALG